MGTVCIVLEGAKTRMDMVAVSYGALGCNNIGGATESADGYGCSLTEDAVVQMGTVAMS